MPEPASNPAPAPERFLEVFLDQNNKCNLKCRMCGFSDPRVAPLPKFDLSFPLFRKIAAEIFPRTRYLALSCMTEPLMTRDIGERLALVGVSGIPFVEIITNGTLLSEAIVRSLIAARISRMAVSIDGATKETFEKIRVGANFETVLENIRRFSRIKRETGAALPHLRVNHTLSPTNAHEFDRFLNLLESLEPQSVDVRTVVKFSNALDTGTKDSAFYVVVQEVREKLDAFCRRTGIENVGILRWQPTRIEIFQATGERATCPRPWNTVAIHANGDILPCITWTRPPFGNLARQSFDEIWTGEAAESIRGEFTRAKPGVDCEYCTIKKDVSVPEGEDDDFFYRMIAKSRPVLPDAG
ncbi:MAG: radical SAM protein [Thermoanaerobaculia bacterium]